MNATGIIVEYNPFHNGHKYHIEKAKELTNPDVLIAVCSGNYCQRGDLSIIDKFKKTQAALDNGVDLVVELPFISTVQNAYVFANTSVHLLDLLGCKDIVFGSETNNIEELKKFAELSIDVTHLKELMRTGASYPKAYGLLAGSLYPNDILAVAYLRAMADTDIKAHTIARTNDYHSDELSIISSASAIRKALKEGRNVAQATPVTIEEPIFTSDMYKSLQRALYTKTREQLQEIFLVSEGIEKLLIDNAYKYDDYEEFIRNSISKRYTRSRVQRVCMMILNNITKADVKELEPVEYIRILGFNDKGRQYLKELKEKELNIITQFKQLPEKQKALEWKVSSTYATFRKDRAAYLKRELQGPLIKR